MEGSFFSLEPAELVLSTVKPAEAGGGIIVRVFNASKTETIQGQLETMLDVKAVVQVTLEEIGTGDDAIQVEQAIGAILLAVPPVKIVTLKLSP
jgi:alpha-mannosidase